jgi:tRNA(adenine34) deaminase
VQRRSGAVSKLSGSKGHLIGSGERYGRQKESGEQVWEAKSAPEIARSLASKKVSPKGAASGMRMLTYFINRGGKGLSKTRRAELEKAKALLSKRVATERAERERKKAA